VTFAVAETGRIDSRGFSRNDGMELNP